MLHAMQMLNTIICGAGSPEILNILSVTADWGKCALCMFDISHALSFLGGKVLLQARISERCCMFSRKPPQDPPKHLTYTAYVTLPPSVKNIPPVSRASWKKGAQNLEKLNMSHVLGRAP